MHKFIQKNTWVIVVLGVLLFIVGESQTAGKSANGTNKQMLFDLITLVGFILFLGGVVVLFRKRKTDRPN